MQQLPDNIIVGGVEMLEQTPHALARLVPAPADRTFKKLCSNPCGKYVLWFG
jgi:hypothetical protein